MADPIENEIPWWESVLRGGVPAANALNPATYISDLLGWMLSGDSEQTGAPAPTADPASADFRAFENSLRTSVPGFERFGANTGTYNPSPEEVSGIVQALMNLGFSKEIATDLALTDPIGAFKLIQSAADGSGGGSGNALGYAQLGESRRQFDTQFAEDVRQFGITEAFRRDELRQRGQQFAEDLQFRKEDATGFVDGAPTVRKQELGENIRQFDVSSTESAAIDRAALAEQARQANLASATSAFGDVTRVTPQLGQLALNNAEFTRDVLKSAPDYLARAFFQQGQSSPLPQVSQADIINSLKSNIGLYNDTLAGFNPQVGAYVPPPAFNPTAVLPQPGGAFPTATPTATTGGGVTGELQFFNPENRLTGGVVSRTDYTPEDFANKASPFEKPRDVTVPALAGGGVAMEPVVVGEKGPELAVPMGPMLVLNEEQLGFNPKKLTKAKKAANGGLFGFNTPSLPTFAGTTQNEIQSLEASVRPPSINAILGGGLAQSPRFGFDLFTPQQIRSLTPESREALGTTLGTQFNETLENVGFAQEQRFGPTRQRGRAQQIAGFA